MMKNIFTLILFICNLAVFSQNFTKISSYNPFEVSKNATLYTKPNFDSHSFKNSEFIKPLESSTKWIKVKALVNDTVIYGYIHKNDIYTKEFYLYNHSFKVIPLTLNQYNKQFLLKITSDTGLVDTLKLTNYHHGANFQEMPYKSALQNINKVIRFQTFREACPGLTSNAYYGVTNNNKIIKIQEEVSTGEGDYYESEILYQPVKFYDDSTVKLVNYTYNGDIMNHSNGELMTYKNPEKFGVPIQNLVIKVILSEGEKYDVTTESIVYDDNGDPIIEKSKTTVIYKWSENKLIEIKKIKD